MALFSKAGSILRQAVNKQINHEISASNPSVFQIIRCMSSSKLFIGGLAYTTDETGLREAFDKYGEVIEARVITDRETGNSRGFGFVTYADSEAASSAIQALDGRELYGRQVRVNYANDSGRSSRGYGYGNVGGSNYSGSGNYERNNYSSGLDSNNYGRDTGNYGNNNYGSNTENYGNQGGNNYSSYGSNNYGSNTGNFASRGGFGSSISGEGGGNDYVNDGGVNGFGAGSGVDGNTSLGYSSGSQLGSNETPTFADPGVQDGQFEGNFREVDDTEPDDYASRRG